MRPRHWLMVFAGVAALGLVFVVCTGTPEAETTSRAPAAGVPFDDVVRLEAGWGETCVITKAGRLYCAGGSLQAYDHSIETARPVPGTDHTIDVSVGHPTCAVRRDGRVTCWGTRTYDTLPDGVDRSTVAEIPGLGGVYRVLTGTLNSPSWAFTEDGIFEWGAFRPLEGGRRFAPPRTAVGLGSGRVEQAVNSGPYCVRDVDGGARCWNFRFGPGVAGGKPVLQDMPKWAPKPVIDITAQGLTRVCALGVDGHAECWQYAERDGEAIPYDHAFVGDHRWKDIAMGDTSACGIKRDGSVWCQGENDSGQLGVATPRVSEALVHVPGVPGATAVAVGRRHACALLDSGTVMCWGRNSSGELGSPPRGARVPPQPFLRSIPKPGQ